MANRRLTFLLRLGSSIALWVVIGLALAWKVPIFYLALICGLALVAQWEFFQMLRSAGIQTFSVTATFLSAVFLIGSFLYYRSHTIHTGFDSVVVLLLVVALLIRQIFTPTGQLASCQATVFTLFGILYIPWTFHFLSKIIFLTPPSANGDPTGPFYALFAIIVTKCSDMGAYAFGSFFGQHRLAPQISPKKTWEGLLGAIVSAGMVALVAHILFSAWLPLFHRTNVLFLGSSLGGVAIVGDLAESVIKRSIQAKDSGCLLPGIGGALDLVDSLLFTGPFLFFYLHWIMHSL
ncbi:Phosphatidate cytidylyltransferase [Candidatus Xiphinematobacter sp. Idaho Grape]|uniref:phosphatidate cytidylyltransferase n=1 Tax=Candidatus Xiphinematobacter sp. Idaho Grape TaxID=1704307 RepID=UPI000706BAA9|nr:phosphatidate cytidylyltransferase [Candidatus Xiphinematobacter sp. Idaho Grape]ALJ56345.1 Phosphatidate cytidylyltransferase [Candidatus Xiphinematobacter sp. Idaho Grape]